MEAKRSIASAEEKRRDGNELVPTHGHFDFCPGFSYDPGFCTLFFIFSLGLISFFKIKEWKERVFPSSRPLHNRQNVIILNYR